MNEIQILKELIRIDSINPFKTVTDVHGDIYGVGNEEEILDYIEPFMKEAGYSCDRQLVQKEIEITTEAGPVVIRQRTNLLCEKGSGDSSLLFSGHVDTVEVKHGWDTEEALSPVEKVVEGKERIYGLGSNDMLSGVAVMIHVAQTAKIQEGKKVKMAFLSDEEFWSIGANTLCASEFVKDVKVVIVPEIGDSEIEPPADRKRVILGRMGRSEFEFNLIGTGGHGAASRKEGLVSAAVEASKLVIELEKYSEDIKKTFTFGEEQWESITNSAFVNKVDVGMGGLSIPDKGQVLFDRSFVPGEKIEEELDTLKDFLSSLYEKGILTEVHGKRASVEVRPRPTPASDAYFTDKNNQWVTYVQKVMSDLNFKMAFSMGNSVADENIFARELGVPVIVIGPTGEDCHAPHEWVDVKSVNDLYSVYKKIVTDL
jgi:acetylornithine deacetylase/succinyl-diaminopimelate desuccinylase-like protein